MCYSKREAILLSGLLVAREVWYERMIHCEWENYFLTNHLNRWQIGTLLHLFWCCEWSLHRPPFMPLLLNWRQTLSENIWTTQARFVHSVKLINNLTRLIKFSFAVVNNWTTHTYDQLYSTKHSVQLLNHLTNVILSFSHLCFVQRQSYFYNTWTPHINLLLQVSRLYLFYFWFFIWMIQFELIFKL